MKRRKSIRSKLLFTTTLVVVALALLLVGVMTYFMNALTDDILQETLQTMAKTAAQSVEGNLHILADRIFMIRDNAVFSSPASTIEDKQIVLDKAKSGIEFVWLALYDEKGALSTGSEGSPINLTQFGVFALMEKTQNLAIGDTDINHSSNELEIVIGAPITTRVNDETVVTGYLAGSYKYDVLNDVLSNINIGSNGTAFIVNGDGQYMAHRDVSAIHAQDTMWDSYTKNETMQNLFKDMMLGKTGVLNISRTQGEAYFCYSPVRGTNWALVITAPRSDFSQTMLQAIFTGTIITFALLILFIIIINIFIRKTLVSPLALITDNARELAVGSATSALPEKLIKRMDEIGELASAFTEMSGALNALISDTNMLVASTQEGMLSVRADADKHEGNYRKIITGLNQTMDLMVDPIKDIANALQEMEKGNLGIRIENEYNGDFLYLKNSINGTLGAIQEYIFEVTEALQSMAEGDLSVTITSEFHGEFVKLKDAINSISASLSSVMKDIHSSADMVAFGTQKVFTSARAASMDAMKQERSIEELISAITGITEQTKSTADNANETSKMVAAAKQFSESGRKSMQSMQDAMEEINTSATGISKIIKVIDDLAFQTNILALNAAVEAARAGSYGKGFAVVAEEVRNLAAKSASAAKDTTQMIESSISKAEAGTAIADGTFTALGNILDSVENVSGIVGQIAMASSNQAVDISQINKEINELSRSVQMNSANAQATTDEADNLSSQADRLKLLVSRFKLRPSEHASVKLIQNNNEIGNRWSGNALPPGMGQFREAHRPE